MHWFFLPTLYINLVKIMNLIEKDRINERNFAVL